MQNGLKISSVGISYTVCEIGASSQDTLLADSNHWAYRPCHQRDGTAGTPELELLRDCTAGIQELIYSCSGPPYSDHGNLKVGPGGADGGWTSQPPAQGSSRLARVCCGPDGAAGGRGP